MTTNTIGNDKEQWPYQTLQGHSTLSCVHMNKGWLFLFVASPRLRRKIPTRPTTCSQLGDFDDFKMHWSSSSFHDYEKEQPTIADEPGEYNKSLSNFNWTYLASSSWVEACITSLGARCPCETVFKGLRVGIPPNAAFLKNPRSIVPLTKPW
jgi:hypothetical protein